jgi:DNA-binding NarL/FixJ family response regulator
MLAPGRILLADDEITFLHATAALIRKEGFDVTCVESASDVAEKLAAQAYDLLIADIHMPGNTDLELVGEVARIVEDLPVILITGYPSVRTAAASIRLPVTAYLVKPFDLAELLEYVRSSIERRRAAMAYRTMRERLQKWSDDLANCRWLFEPAERCGAEKAVDSLLRMVFGNFAHCLADLKSLVELSTEPTEREKGLGVGGSRSDVTAAQPGAAAVSNAITLRMRKTLERLASDLEEFGIVTHSSANPEIQANLHNLSRREWEIVRQLRAHRRVGTIARSLHLSEHTVRNHLKSVFRKLGVHSQEELLKVLAQGPHDS